MSDARSVPVGVRGRSRYRQVTIGGFLLMGMDFLLVVAIVGLVMAVVPLGLSLVMAGLVWKFGRWAALLAAFLGLVLAPISLLLLLFALQSEGRVPLAHTVIILLMVVGAFMCLVGGVGAFVKNRRVARSTGSGD